MCVVLRGLPDCDGGWMSERTRMSAAIAIGRLRRGFDAMQVPRGRSCAVFSLILVDTNTNSVIFVG